MEAETTEKTPVTGEVNDFGVLMNTCAKCKEGYTTKNAKLLPCLHTVCEQCLQTLTFDVKIAGNSPGGQLVKCPRCPLETNPNQVISNLFATPTPVSPPLPKDAESGDAEADAKMCTGCEENTAATSYCQQCQEYLCDQCVQAHKRVKVTKDHTIQPKDETIIQEASLDSLVTGPRVMLCPLHKEEPLKLYCETCEKLTCRDCQLLEHKDHKYQFVDEAADNYKRMLSSLLGKIQEKKNYVENAKELIDKRHAEISEKEQKVATDIKTFIMKVAQELNKRGKQLMMDLQNICKAKKGQLDTKSKEVRGLSKTLDHTLKFAQFSLEKSNNAALMYTRKALNLQLRDVLKIRCEVPNPYHIIDMKFGYDPKTPLIQIPQLGAIFVDGIPFNPASSTALAAISVAGANAANQAGIVPQPNQSNHRSRSGEEVALSNQQKAMLMMKMKNIHQQQQIGYRQSTSPSSSTGIQALHMLSQLSQPQGQPQMGPIQPQMGPIQPQQQPHQSSFISSSNGVRGAFYPSSMKGPHMGPGGRPNVDNNMAESLIQINLNHLQPNSLRQDQRQAREMAQHAQQAQFIHAAQARQSNIFHAQQAQASAAPPNTSMQNPIVIAPTGDYPDIPDIDSMITPVTGPSDRTTSPRTALSDCMHAVRNDNVSRNVKPEDRQSCVYATRAKTDSRPLSATPDDITASFSVGSHSSGSRTPTPRAESTTVTTPTLDNNAVIDLDANSNSAPTEDFATFLLNNSLSSATAPLTEALGTSTSASASASTSASTSAEKMDTAPTLTTQISETPSTPRGLIQSPGRATPARSTGTDKVSDDPSDDWCAVCNNGGDLLCCDTCPKVFHIACHVPNVPVAPSATEEWYCGLCVKDEQLKIEARLDNTTGKLLEKECKLSERILLELFSREESAPFHEPVSDSVPNYYKIIGNPMDFGSLKKKLAKGKYANLENFLKDVQLVFTNCATYNLPESPLGIAGKTLEKFFCTQLTRYCPFVDPASLPPLDDSQEIDTSNIDSPLPSTGGPPRKKQKRSKALNEDEEDEDWTVETSEEDEETDLKRKFKRKKDGGVTSGSETDPLEDAAVVHVR